MDTYTVKKAYPFDFSTDIEIESENLIYIEFGELSGMQCNNQNNYDIINKKCIEISKLIKEIDILNK